MTHRVGAQHDAQARIGTRITSTYTVAGLTCGACIAEVMEGIRLLPGVSGVAVKLVSGGPSPLFIESRRAIASEIVCQTIERVGFHATDTNNHLARHLPGPSQAASGSGALLG